MALMHYPRSTNRTGPIIMVSIGIFQYYIYWILTHHLGLPIIASVSAIVGTFLQIIGITRLIQRAKTAQSAALLVCMWVGLGLFWGSSLLIYVMNIIETVYLQL